MSKAIITEGQARSIIGSFVVDTPWNEIQVDLQSFIQLTPQERGLRFAAFLRNGCRLNVGEPRIIRIDSGLKFNPAEFIGSGWATWKGPADGDGLTGEEDLDKRSLALTEADLTTAVFESGLKPGESSINGEEKLKRLRAFGNVQFGGNVFLALWLDYQQNKENSSLEWIWRNRKISWMSFFGLVLRGPDGFRDVLCFYRNDDEWYWGYVWLGRGWDADGLSAGLAS